MYDFPDPRNTWGYSKVLAGTGALTKRVESKKLTPPKFNSLPQKIDDLKDSFPFGDCADCLFFKGRTVQFLGFFTQKARYGGEFLAAQFKKHHFVRSVYSTFGGTAQNSSDLQITTTNLRTSTIWNVCFFRFSFNTGEASGESMLKNLTPKKQRISPEVRDHS